MVDQPHDALFRETFSDPVLAAAELKSILPAEVVALFDWPSLRLESGSLVSVDDRRHCDLLFTLDRIGTGDPALVFVLFEHQSSDDKLMALRMLGYMVKAWESWAARTENRAPPLPFILPVVLSHDPRGWRSATRFEQLFDGDASLADLRRRFVPNFEFVLDDLAQATNDRLAARALPDIVALSLWALRDGRSQQAILQHIPFFAAFFERLAGGKSSEDAVDRLMQYLGQAAGEQSIALTVFQAEIAKHSPSAGQVIMNSIEKLKEEGRSEGRSEGLTRGRAEGRAEGQREMLRQALAEKFGPLSSAHEDAIVRADSDALNAYLKRAMTADSLDAVFGA